MIPSRQKLFIDGMRLVPKKRLSRMVRRLASVQSKMAVRRFAARYDVAVEEAEKPIDEYGSVLEFFTRRLKPGARPIDSDPQVLVCPVDGTFLAGGAIGAGKLVQAKGRDFTLRALLADDDAEQVFKDGTYLTFYLAPRDYHRIHSPVSGLIFGFTHLPGTLFPVNPAAVAHVDGLFAKNERLITHIDSVRFGRVEVVKVGATCVGHITLAYDSQIATNVDPPRVWRHAYEEAIPTERGAELGVFEMGSTVIIVTERPVDLVPLEPNQSVRLGVRLGVPRLGAPPSPPGPRP